MRVGSKTYVPVNELLGWLWSRGQLRALFVDGRSVVAQGMPHKVYHGRTGIVWNVTKRAVGVEVNKQVNGRIIRKRIHVRVEHVAPSRCKEEFLRRRKENDAIKHEAKVKGGACP